MNNVPALSATFPKKAAFSVHVNDLDSATRIATNKRKNGGCFEKSKDGYLVFWMPAGVKHNFAW